MPCCDGTLVVTEKSSVMQAVEDGHVTDLDLWRAPARPCGSAKPAAAEPGLDPDLDVELELGKCRADAKTRGRPPGRRRAWVVAGVAALAACAAAAGWIGLAGGADELAGFAGRPREDQLASAGPAVMDHGEDNTAFPEYIIGLDAWAGLQELGGTTCLRLLV